ncbi:hypothetical protein FRB90_000152 [Tulasnella sp. 427]|nr:hypothetical protein FRB90_000152 [Tulasnella sp. 427]
MGEPSALAEMSKVSNSTKRGFTEAVGRTLITAADPPLSAIVQQLQEGNPDTGIKFFKEEFELDYALARLTTPYIAILDGVTMGGGVGLSINAMFRVATENTVFAMPETKIGYSPDVGASFFLPRLDGALGTYLGLTGESLRGRETGASPDFVTGVKALLIDKAKGRPEWSPNKIADVTPSTILSKFFSRESPFKQKVPEASFTSPESLSFPTDPMKFSLPSEEEIGRLVRGEHPSSSSTAFSLPELLQKTQELWGKQGVEVKVNDVVSRRCEVVPKSGMEEAHVRWIH